MKIKRALSPIIFQIVLYVLQFLILPSVYYISPFDVARSMIAIFLSTLFITIVGMTFFSDALRNWLLGLILHLALVIIYHPDDIYGIGNGMFDFDIITMIFIFLLIMGTQVFVWLFLKLFRRIIKKVAEKNS